MSFDYSLLTHHVVLNINWDVSEMIYETKSSNNKRQAMSRVLCFQCAVS